MNSGGEDDQFGVVRERHAGPVDALVAKPRAAELVRIEEDHGLLDLAIHHLEVHLQAQGRGQLKALDVVADVQAAHHQLARVVLAYYRLHVDDRQVRGEVVAGVVQHAADGRIRAAHHALHAVDGSEEVAAMNPDGAAGAYEDVFVVVGHANYLVGDDLADREDEVVAAVAEQLVHLRGPRVIDLALADVVEELAGDFAQGHYVVAPVVHAEEATWRRSVHGGDLIVRHGLMGAQGGQHVCQLVAVVLPGKLRQKAALGVHPGEVGRDRQHFFANTKLIERGKQVRLDLSGRHLSCRTSSGKKKTHGCPSYSD